MINKTRFILTSILAWLLLLMLDFLAHATLLSHFWAQDYPAQKSKEELFRLIPFGYLSFLILTLLIGWIYVRFYREGGNAKKGLSFGAAFGGLFALMTFLGWYSALNLPALFILLISVVYFVEIVAVGFTYGYLIHPESVKKRVWVLISIIIFGLVLSVILQNVMPSTQQMSAAVL
jgi:hypothetical protein